MPNIATSCSNDLNTAINISFKIRERVLLIYHSCFPCSHQ